MADYSSEERAAALAAVNGIIALRNAHARDLREDAANAVPFTHELLLVTDWLRRVAELPASGVSRADSFICRRTREIANEVYPDGSGTDAQKAGRALWCLTRALAEYEHKTEERLAALEAKARG